MSEPLPNERRVVKFPDYLDADGVLTCPDCGCQDFSVERSPKWFGGWKKRERECKHCARRIDTIEIVDENGEQPPERHR